MSWQTPLELLCGWFYLAFTPLVPVARPFAWLIAGCPDPSDFPKGP